jgi:DNA-binding transcriptional MerR regulator
MAQLAAVKDLHLLKEQLRSLQESFLFAEYSNEGNTRRYSEDEDERMDNNREGRKKVPIRIWGINS